MKQKTWTGWLELIVGILLLAEGIHTLTRPDAALIGLSFLYGCLAVFTGIYVIRITLGNAHYYFSLIVNIIGLVLAVFMLINPFLTILSVSYIIGCYLIFLGIDGIVIALNTLGTHR